MDSDRLKETILRNAEEITRLHKRVHDTFKHRDESPERRREWVDAADEFRRRYDMLAFPGGERDARGRIATGDPEAIESAICFLELRPYFFRSGYMFNAMLRHAKRAPLSAKQRARLTVVQERRDEWRRRKAAGT